MPLTWTHENPPRWDADKARIVGGAPKGALDETKLGSMKAGDLVPGEWWRVAADGNTVGYGWMDTTWGDAEILLAVAPSQQKRGVGSFILDHLHKEARARALNYLYNQVPAAHPEPAAITAWLGKRGFQSGEGRLLKAAVRR